MRGSHGLVGRRKCCLRLRWRRAAAALPASARRLCQAPSKKRCLRLCQAQVEAAAAASLRPRVTV